MCACACLCCQVRQDEFTRVYRDRREGVQVAAPVDIARVLAAKNDLLTIRKTSHQSERMATQTSINKAVIVGKVCENWYCCSCKFRGIILKSRHCMLLSMHDLLLQEVM